MSKYEVYMEQVRSTIVEVSATTWQEALRIADGEGVPQHEDGDVSSDWSAVIATGPDGVEHSHEQGSA